MSRVWEAWQDKRESGTTPEAAKAHPGVITPERARQLQDRWISIRGAWFEKLEAESRWEELEAHNELMAPLHPEWFTENEPPSE